MKYLLTLSTRTVHISDSKDGRCKLSQIRDENQKVFDTLEEAMVYLPTGNKPTKICSFCQKYMK